MAGSRVIVVGAINTDFVVKTTHLPAPGETVVGGGLQIFGGGKGANAAVAAARAGADVMLIGAVGADTAGADALAALRDDGVDTSGVAVLQDIPTGAALIIVDGQGQNQIALGPGANGAVTAAHVLASLERVLPDAAVVLVSTEIPYAAVAAAVQATTRARVRCVLNPAPVIDGLEHLLAQRVLLTPNEGELSELANRAGYDEPAANAPAGDVPAENMNAVLDQLRYLGELTDAPVIVTLGSAGCAMRLPNDAIERIPAPSGVPVVDTTGAGDTFNGVLVACLARTPELVPALRTAVVAGSLSVGASGARAGMPRADTLTSAIAGSAVAHLSDRPN